VEGVLSSLELRRAEREHDLAFLLGRNPGPLPRGKALAELPVPPTIPAGLPSALLERRPDIRAAERRLIAANARIGEARALLYPRLTLTGQAGYASTQLSGFLRSPSGFWDLIGGVTAPIWDWGRNRARVEETEAVKRQAVILYEDSIRRAFKDVEDALVAYRRAAEILESSARRMNAQREALRLSENRYRGGVSAYLEVLDAQRELFDAELGHASALRATGASWPSSAPPRSRAPAPKLSRIPEPGSKTARKPASPAISVEASKSSRSGPPAIDASVEKKWEKPTPTRASMRKAGSTRTTLLMPNNALRIVRSSASRTTPWTVSFSPEKRRTSIPA
jgi:hypothetical protein